MGDPKLRMWLSTMVFITIIIMPNGYCILFSIDAPKTSENYGPYDVNWKYYGVCPMSDVNIAQASIELVKKNNIYIGYMNFSVPINTRLDEMKVAVYNVKGKRKTTIWNYKMDKPCQHDLFASVIRQQMGAKSCFLKEGDYYCTVNFSDSVKKIYGPAFFYGEYLFKITVLSKKQIVTCLVFHEVLTKKV